MNFLIVISIIAIFTDLKYGKIYNWLTLPALFIGLFIVIFTTPLDLLPLHLVSLLIFTLLSIPLFQLNWLGGGDIKLLYAFSIHFLPMNFLLLFLTISIVGGIFATFYMIFRPKQKHLPYSLPIFSGLLIYLTYLL